MCGRFLLITPARIIAELFRAHSGLTGAEPPLLFEPRYNIAPMQPVLAVRRTKEGGERELAAMRWGLIPNWATDDSVAATLINCRSESAFDRPMFRNLYHRRRCLVPANGFYEWKAVAGRKKKQPILLTAGDAHELPVVAMAALWDRWKPPGGEPVDSLIILTRAANQQIAPIHDRMPAIVPQDQWDDWLSGKDMALTTDPHLTITPVSSLVSNVKNDGPELIRPVVVEEQGGLF